MSVIHAIFEGGVFRPLEPVGLPEHSEVSFEPCLVNPSSTPSENQRAIYEILGRSYDTGRTDLASRIDEHQP